MHPPARNYPHWLGLLLALALLLAQAACRQAPVPGPTPTATIRPKISPYLSPTPLPPSPGITPRQAVPLTPAPTPTPFLHTITNDDTLLGIALKYGISLEDLQAANPETDPHFLSVGKTLIIPLEGQDPAFLATPTPAQVQVGEPRCYRTAEGGAWCFVLVDNPLPQAVENLSAWISLFSEAGDPLVGKEAIAPLNRLESGAALPLTVYFEPPLPGVFAAQAQLLSAIPIAEEDQRYLPAAVQVDLLEISPEGAQAHVEGSLVLSNTQEVTGTARLPQTAWVAVVAYGETGEVVGLRKWEAGSQGVCAQYVTAGTPTGASIPTGTSQPGFPRECLDFSIEVYSLAAPITRVELLVEAR